MMMIPKITILMADLAADCFRATPLKAPISESKKMPIPIDVFTEYI